MKRHTPPATPGRPVYQRILARLIRFLWRLFLAFVKLTIVGVILAATAIIIVYRHYSRDLPDPAQIGRHRPAETGYIYARDGTLLYELVDPLSGKRTVVPFERIPRILIDATVAVEDAGFWENPGVDLRGILRALILNYQAGEVVSGGSTITQQLVRNVLLSPEERDDLSLDRKLREAILAIEVARRYSKEQILGVYLNEVYYGNRAYGVEAAAQAYFGKHVWELSPGEATLLAGLPQSPTTLNPLRNLEGAKQRQRITLDLMVKHGYLTESQAQAIFDEPLRFASTETSIIAPHFVFYVLQLLEERYGPETLYRGGLRVVTTLDPMWQAEAERIARQWIREGGPGYAPLRERGATNAGVVMLTPDAQIIAMVGSIDYNDPTINGQVNVTLAPRQPGSALKPIVYAAALQRGWTPATIIWDTPVTYPVGDGTVYAPRNYDNAFHGPQRLRMALANSLNIPAVRTLEFVGIEEFVSLAHRMGITTLNDPQRYGLPLALGAGEVRLLDLTAVYNTFRNGGRYRPPIAILKVTNARGETLEIASDTPARQTLGDQGEQIAYLITDILSDNVARRYMFGRNNVMELPDGRPAAVKTGTSDEWRDSWTIGYTPDITVGVWVGNNDNSPMQEVAGSNGAGVIWRAIMERYHQGRPILTFEPPEGIREVMICADTGALAGDHCPRPIKERFVAGTEPRTSDVTLLTVGVSDDGKCLAASYTPPERVRRVTFVVYPPAFRAWAEANGIPQPPQQYCPPPEASAGREGGSFARITQPITNTTVRSPLVYIRGAALGVYALDVAPGRDPIAGWRTIARGEAIRDGVLGIWQTGEYAPGEYTLRLRVTSNEGVLIEQRVWVRLEPARVDKPAGVDE
ncbi:MAG: PBP1A family penicillin-binding protein [Roseiflexus sp.]|nr:PBP1A family penicillin-binding protein [Roseiflexus sp.]